MLCFPSVKNRKRNKIIFDSCKKRQISSQKPTKTTIPPLISAILSQGSVALPGDLMKRFAYGAMSLRQ